MLRHLLAVLFLSGPGISSEILNLREGSACLRNEVAGKCVSIYDCLSSYLDFMNKDFAPICSFRNKEPIVCCTDCTFNDTRNLVFNNNLGIIHKSGQKAQDKCIEYIHKLDYPCKGHQNARMKRVYKPDKNCNEIIIQFSDVFAVYEGVDAFREEFPHMGLLGYGDDIRAANWLCGGTVISERFILTAGHCLSSPSVGPVKYVALGILKRTDPPELWQIYNVKRTIPHPEYKSPSKYHDIALLETDTEIIFSGQVLPACLHATGEADAHLYATGWGALGHRKELVDTLQKVGISRLEEQECSKYYPPHRHLKNGYNHTTQMCYGDKDGRDTCEVGCAWSVLKSPMMTQCAYTDPTDSQSCESRQWRADINRQHQGDSGGPLQSNGNNYSGKTLFCVYTVIGVTSYGRQCGIAEGSGIYTRVIYYVPWIESVVWP